LDKGKAEPTWAFTVEYGFGYANAVVVDGQTQDAILRAGFDVYSGPVWFSVCIRFGGECVLAGVDEQFVDDEAAGNRTVDINKDDFRFQFIVDASPGGIVGQGDVAGKLLQVSGQIDGIVIAARR